MSGFRSPSQLVSFGQFGVSPAITDGQTRTGRYAARQRRRTRDRKTALVSAQSDCACARLRGAEPPRVSFTLVWAGFLVDGHLDGSSDPRLVDLRADQLGAAPWHGTRHSGDSFFATLADRRQYGGPLLTEVSGRFGAVCQRLFVRRDRGADFHRIDLAVACLRDGFLNGLRAGF